MRISTQTLFNAIKEDPKQAQRIVKSATSETLLGIESSKADLIGDKVKQNLGKVLDNLFNKIINGQSTKEQIAKTIQNNPILKSQSTTSTDVKDLLNLVQKEPKLSKFIAPLKEFLKHVSTIDGKNLKTQVENSGVGLESKLASQSSKPTLLHEAKNILKQVLNSSSITKNIDAKAILNDVKQLLSKKEVFKEDIVKIKNEVAKFIKNIPQPKMPQIQNLLKTLDKLELALPTKENLTKEINIKDTIPKETLQKDILTQNTKETLQIKTPKENIQANNAKISHFADKKLQVVLKNLDTQISHLQKDLPKDTPNLPKIKNFIKDMQIVLKSLEKPLNTSEQQVVQVIANSTPTLQVPQNVQVESLNVQDKLKMLTNKLKQTIEIVDKQALSSRENLKDAKTLLKTLDKNISTLPNKNAGAEQIKQDIKQTLMQIKEASSNQPHLKEINNLANKALTNIEVNQLASYTNNSLSTYVPYTWEGLEEGNVAFKSGEEDNFYCQIDLELKFYGRINAMLMLSQDNYVNISISTEKESLKDKIQDNIKELRKSLTEVGLISAGITFKPYEEKDKYNENWGEFNVDLKA